MVQISGEVKWPILPVILMGMPGSGKTTVGRELARQLQLEFRDCDEEIVKRIRISIPDYFARCGEVGFRQKEAEVIADLKDFPGVFSLGGGALTGVVNQRQLAGKTLVYLESSKSTLLARIGVDSGRPLLDGGEGLAAKLEALALVREPVFEKLARIRIRVDELTVAQIVTKIISKLEVLEQNRKANTVSPQCRL